MSNTAYPYIMNLVADITSAYLSNNEIPPEMVPVLIKETYKSLENVSHEDTAEPQTPPCSPAVNPKDSVFEDFIICLEDGKKMKTLKRHLKAEHDMTPEQYRDKWNLPETYPLVSPNYAKRRSDLALQNKLGRK